MNLVRELAAVDTSDWRCAELRFEFMPYSNPGWRMSPVYLDSAGKSVSIRRLFTDPKLQARVYDYVIVTNRIRKMNCIRLIVERDRYNEAFIISTYDPAIDKEFYDAIPDSVMMVHTPWFVLKD